MRYEDAIRTVRKPSLSGSTVVWQVINSKKGMLVTLIAVFGEAHPIGISDVMLSARLPPVNGVMPNGTQFNADQFQPGEWAPHRYSQKMTILGDGNVLALGAGDFSRMKMVISGLKNDLNKGLTIDDLPAWLQSKAPLCGTGTVVIVSWIDATEHTTGSVGQDVQFSDESGTKIRFSGSGGEWFRNLPVTIGRTHFKLGEFDQIEMVRMRAIAQTGFHLLNERTIGTRQGFGGGFQAAYYDGTRFRMCEDVTYLLWKMVHDDEGAPVHLDLYPQIVVQRYREPFLYFDVASLTPDVSTVRDGRRIFGGHSLTVRTAVEPLLSDPRRSLSVPERLDTTPFIDNHIVHVWGKKLIDISGHQLLGDADLSDVRISQGDDGRYLVELGATVYRAFLSRQLKHNWKQRAVDL